MPNIFEMFAKLKEMDEELVEFSFEDQKDLLQDTQVKVDSYVEVRARLKYEAERVGLEIEKLKNHQQRLQKQTERLEEYLFNACKAFQITEFKGNKNRIKLIATTRYRPKFPPDSECFTKYGPYCLGDISYKWNRDALLEGFKIGDPLAKEVFEEYQSEYLRFS